MQQKAGVPLTLGELVLVLWMWDPMASQSSLIVPPVPNSGQIRAFVHWYALGLTQL